MYEAWSESITISLLFLVDSTAHRHEGTTGLGCILCNRAAKGMLGTLRIRTWSRDTMPLNTFFDAPIDVFRPFYSLYVLMMWLVVDRVSAIYKYELGIVTAAVSFQAML
jgi:hypothetical protein